MVMTDQRQYEERTGSAPGTSGGERISSTSPFPPTPSTPSRATSRSDQQAAGSWVLNLLEIWFHHVAPAISSSPKLMSASARARVRRGRISAYVLGILACSSAFACLVTGLLTLLSPAPVTVAGLIVAITLAFCCVGPLAELNRRGHVELVGFTIALLVMILVLGAIAAGDLPAPGFDWIDAPGLDLMLIGLFVGGLILRPWQTWALLVIYLGLILGYLAIVPHATTLLTTDIVNGLVTPALPASFREAGLYLDLLYRPIVFALFATFFGIGSQILVLSTLEARDEQAYLAVQRAEQLQRQQIEQEWLAQNVALLERTQSRGYRYIPADIPPGIQSPFMTAVHGLLTMTGVRMDEGQQALSAIRRLRGHAQRLASELSLDRATGGRARQHESVNEWTRITLPVLQTGAGFVVADEYVLALHGYLTLLNEELIRTEREIINTLDDQLAGASARRLSMQTYKGPLGEVAIHLNLFLDALHPMPQSRYQSPFLNDRALDVPMDLSQQQISPGASSDPV